MAGAHWKGEEYVFGYQSKSQENFLYERGVAFYPKDFWKRWHISLTSWFRDYVYIVLGGNRVRFWGWVANIMIVFFTGFLLARSKAGSSGASGRYYRAGTVR